VSSYALVKAPALLLPQEDVTLGVIVHDNDKVLVKFSQDSHLAEICGPILPRTRFNALEIIFANTLQGRFITSRDSEGNIPEIQRADPNFLKLVADHWQDSVLRVEYGGSCPKKWPVPEEALQSLYEENVLAQKLTTLTGNVFTIEH